MLKRLGN